MAKYIYPAIFAEVGAFYTVRFPDFETCYTQGENLQDAYEMAEDVLSMTLYDAEANHTNIPRPSSVSSIRTSENEFVSLVACDTHEYRHMYAIDVLPDYYAYPAYLYYEPDGISIAFPDLPGCLPCASTTEEAFQNAREALGLHLFGMEQNREEIPAPTPIQDLEPDNNAVLSIIQVFMPAIRERMNNRVVKKTLTIPSWLNSAAMEQGLNLSQVLQDALKDQLHLI